MQPVANHRGLIDRVFAMIWREPKDSVESSARYRDVVERANQSADTQLDAAKALNDELVNLQRVLEQRYPRGQGHDQ